MHLSHILELKSLLKEALGCAVGCIYDCRPGGWELQAAAAEMPAALQTAAQSWQLGRWHEQVRS